MNQSPLPSNVRRAWRWWVVPMLLACCAAAAGAQALATTRSSIPAATQAAQPLPPTLLAFGAAQRFWVANVESYRDGARVRYKTLVRGQTLPAGDWRDLGVVFGQAMALAESQGELAILLDDLSWKRLGNGSLSTGPAIPGTGPVLAWGSVSGVLYAVRGVEGGAGTVTTRPASTTAPARAAATTTTSIGPASHPSVAVPRLALLRFDRGQWEGLADLPPGAIGESISIGGAGSKPLVAFPGEGGALRTFALSDGKWQDWGEVRPGATTGKFGVLSVSNVAAVWIGDADGKLKLFLKREGEEWGPATKFTLPADASAGAQRALAAAGEEFRLIVQQDGTFKEQRYDLTGTSRGSVTPLPTPQSTKPDPYVKVLQYFVVLGMAVVLLVTFYRRRSTIGPKDEEP